MSQEELADLQAMDTEELLGRMEGGFYQLLSTQEGYEDLFKLAAALGIKDFIQSKIAHLDKDRLLAMFADGEQVISLYIRHGVEKGLLEPSGDEEE